MALALKERTRLLLRKISRKSVAPPKSGHFKNTVFAPVPSKAVNKMCRITNDIDKPCAHIIHIFSFKFKYFSFFCSAAPAVAAAAQAAPAAPTAATTYGE